MANSRALIQFVERRYQVLFQDFRVYIQGVEVTNWVSGSLTISFANRDGPGSASFTLDNAMDRFILTAENLNENKWRDTNDKYSEAAKHAIYLYKSGEADVTVDRMKETVSAFFTRNMELANTLSRDQLLAGLGMRKASAKGLTEADLAQMLALDQTIEQVPDDWLSHGNRDKLTSAVASELSDQGDLMASTTARTAVLSGVVDLRKGDGQRPKKSKTVLEVDPNQGMPETKGKHKRQKIIRNPTDSDTGDSRWPLSERSVVFHKNDPIRIFLHNPLSEQDQWLFGFTGFIDQYPVQTDYLTASSSITIQCYDIRALMQKMRVSMNSLTGIVTPEPLFSDRASVFADLRVPSRWGHAFANMAFEDAMATLITGTNLKRKGQGKKFGIGDLAVGKVVTYPAEGSDNADDDVNRAILEEWHTLVINGPSDLNDTKSIANKTFLNSTWVDKIGRGTTSDGPYSPFSSYVHFLLPREGTAARTLTQIQFDAGTDQRDWVTRYEVISDFCARLDYEFTVAPNGDIVFEFPMYDFLPEDFGDWKPAFEADYHLITGGVADESGDIVTAVVVTGGPPVADIDAYSGAPQGLVPRGVIQCSLMASRVGLTIENVSLPFVRSSDRLRSLGFVEFQKRLANANNFDMDFGFRPFITPNRPVLNKVERRMGLTSSVVNTMQVFDICSTAASVRFVRQIRSDGTFRFITGSDSLPISYRKVFPGTVKSVGNATVGVRSSEEFDGDPTMVDNQKVTPKKAPVKNEDRPPGFIKETRPGTFYTLSPKARRIAEIIGQEFDEREILLTNIPRADGNSFAVRARNPAGERIYSDKERLRLARVAKDNGYILIDTRQRFVFDVRRPGQPDFIERPDNDG